MPPGTKSILTADQMASMSDAELRDAFHHGRTTKRAVEEEMATRAGSPLPTSKDAEEGLKAKDLGMEMAAAPPSFGSANATGPVSATHEATGQLAKNIKAGAYDPQYVERAFLQRDQDQNLPRIDLPSAPGGGYAGEAPPGIQSPDNGVGLDSFTPASGAGGSAGQSAAMPTIDPNGIERRSQSTTGYQQRQESGEHRAAMNAQEAAIAQGAAAEKTRAEHAAAYGEQIAQVHQGYAQQLQKGNEAYQAQVQARKDRIADEQRRIDEATAKYQEAAKGAPLGSVLNPKAGQAIMGAIAQALGAFGAGMTGGRNAALDLMNTQLDTELKKQHERVVSARTNVSLAQQHLDDLRAIYKDDDAAHLAWKADQFELAGAKAKALAAQADSQETRDNALKFEAASNEKAAALREQAALQHEKTVSSQTTSSSESGPSVAARAMQAQYAALKAQREATGSGMKYTPQQMQDQTDQEDAFRDVAKAIKANGGRIPGQIVRQLQMSSGSLKDLRTIGQNILADNSMTQEEKNVGTSLLRNINVRLFHDSGKQVTPEEAPRHLAGYGLGPSATPTDVMRNLRVQNDNLTRNRTRMIAADPGLAQVFQAGDMAIKSGPDRPTPGVAVGR